jgi:hypothetical protein
LKWTDPFGLNPNLGDLLGKVWNAPNSAVGLVVGLAGLPFGAQVSLGNNAIQFANNPLTSSGAITLGNVINYGPQLPPNSCSPESQNHTTGEHERQHTYQGQLLGPLYIPTSLFGLSLGLFFDGDSHGPHSLTEKGPQMNPPRAWK